MSERYRSKNLIVFKKATKKLKNRKTFWWKNKIIWFFHQTFRDTKDTDYLSLFCSMKQAKWKCLAKEIEKRHVWKKLWQKYNSVPWLYLCLNLSTYESDLPYLVGFLLGSPSTLFVFHQSAYQDQLLLAFASTDSSSVLLQTILVEVLKSVYKREKSWRKIWKSVTVCNTPLPIVEITVGIHWLVFRILRLEYIKDLYTN